VRELKNVLAYAFAVGEGPIVRPGDLPPELVDPLASLDGDVPATPVPPSPAKEGLSREAQRIAHVLERTAGNRDRAAQILGLSRVTLWRRMRALGLLTPR
jgi:transcriptional regulator of acetoin/glycerol metabolism